jgi:hypothetical protein
MTFNIIDAAKKEFPVQRLCSVLGVSQRPQATLGGQNTSLDGFIRRSFRQPVDHLGNVGYGTNYQ